VQSGADTVLRRMARRCRSADFRTLARAARAAVPDLNLTTDVIVGFPGETEAEWRATLDFVAEIGFGHVHVFPFSTRPGTKASSLPDPVDEPTRQRRSRELHALAERLRRDALARLVGRQVAVLVEGNAGTPVEHGRVWEGYTPSFLRVAIEAPASVELANRIVDARLEAVDPQGGRLLARLACDRGQTPCG